jgi:hypothetical protein
MFPYYYKTPAAARALNVSYHVLFGLIRFRKIPPPGRDSSGDYVWTEADLEQARQALRRCAREEVADAAR